MPGRLSAIRSASPDLLASAELAVETKGEGFTDITRDAARFIEQCGAGEGVMLFSAAHLGLACHPGKCRSGRAGRPDHGAAQACA